MFEERDYFVRETVRRTEVEGRMVELKKGNGACKDEVNEEMMKVGSRVG